jgi:hypothetical protein
MSHCAGRVCGVYGMCCLHWKCNGQQQLACQVLGVSAGRHTLVWQASCAIVCTGCWMVWWWLYCARKFGSMTTRRSIEAAAAGLLLTGQGAGLVDLGKGNRCSLTGACVHGPASAPRYGQASSWVRACGVCRGSDMFACVM